MAEGCRVKDATISSRVSLTVGPLLAAHEIFFASTPWDTMNVNRYSDGMKYNRRFKVRYINRGKDERVRNKQRIRRIRSFFVCLKQRIRKDKEIENE